MTPCSLSVRHLPFGNSRETFRKKIPRAADIALGRCCSATTHQTANSSMQAGSAQGCRSPSWSACGSAFSLWWSRKMPLATPPPRSNRFGSPLVLSRVHWVRPEMVVEVSYGEWTPDGLLRHVVYLGEREDKLAIEVRRGRPNAGEP